MPSQEKIPSADTVLKSFGFALDGMGYAIRTQRNFRIHLVITFFVVAAGIFFRVHAMEWLVLVLVIGLMLAAELFNTALEALADLAADGLYHSLARTAKDLAAAACLVLAVMAVIIGAIVFLPYLL